jgi:hypothetical protein
MCYKSADARQDCSFADARNRNVCCGDIGVFDLLCARQSKSKDLCSSLLRNEAVLRDI